jgi:hypothetical protein
VESVARFHFGGHHSGALGATPMDAVVRRDADRITAGPARDKDRWRRGLTRRRVSAGTGAVGVASLGTHLVTTRYPFADPAQTSRTLIVIFRRAGMDGLSVIQPANDPNRKRLRPTIALDAKSAVAGRLPARAQPGALAGVFAVLAGRHNDRRPRGRLTEREPQSLPGPGLLRTRYGDHRDPHRLARPGADRARAGHRDVWSIFPDHSFPTTGTAGSM